MGRYVNEMQRVDAEVQERHSATTVVSTEFAIIMETIGSKINILAIAIDEIGEKLDKLSEKGRNDKKEKIG